VMGENTLYGGLGFPRQQGGLVWRHRHIELNGHRNGHFRFCRFRSKRPSPTPFSAMNSMPAPCKAVCIAFTASSETDLRSFSKSTTVDRPNLAARASCDWVMPRRARAARHWAGVIEWSIIFVDNVLTLFYQ